MNLKAFAEKVRSDTQLLSVNTNLEKTQKELKEMKEDFGDRLTAIEKTALPR